MKHTGISLYKFALRIITLTYLALLKLACLVVPRRKKLADQPVTILITGTFYSNQWLSTHLVPLALSERVKAVVMVASRPVPEMEGVVAIYPPPLMQKAIGEVAARTLLFAWHGLKGRYDMLAGFHLLLNGMVAVLIARLTYKQSMYICGGGPTEVLGGGYMTENKIYGRLIEPDGFIESMLLSTVREIDLTVCMGTSAVTYFNHNNVHGPMQIVPGGFPPAEFYPTTAETEFDFILVGRLSDVKQVGLFIQAIRLTKVNHKNVSAVIVGDGPDRSELEILASREGLSSNIHFAGWQNNVAEWLRRSRVFVLTSSSEGLSQALLQALMCGLPGVVSNVGDLKDIVSNGHNGYLVDDITATQFSKTFSILLHDSDLLNRLSENAVKSTTRYQVENVAKHWNQIL